MKRIIYAIIGFVVIMLAVETLMAEGKTKKYVYGTIKTLMVLTLMIQIVSSIKQLNGVNIDSITTSEEITIQNDSDSLAFGTKLAENRLKNKGIDTSIELRFDKDSQKMYAQVNITSINVNESNIIIQETIKKEIKTILHIEDDNVMIVWN